MKGGNSVDQSSSSCILKAMRAQIRPVDEHRLDREAGAIIYPVMARRSRGLSVGINLYPDRKVCSFDCPYCEVFPFETNLRFSLEAMERGLRNLASSGDRSFTADSVKDLSFSGNGEPTLHPDFVSALDLAARLRKELFPTAKLVLITNGTGLLDPNLAAALEKAARGEKAGFCEPGQNLEVWLKIDAGTEDWYRSINRSAIPFDALKQAIGDFSRRAPYIIQSMICKIEGKTPPEEEVAAWEAGIRGLVTASTEDPGAGPRAVQLYGKARPAAEDPLAEPVTEAYLLERSRSLRKALEPYQVPIEVYP